MDAFNFKIVEWSGMPSDTFAAIPSHLLVPSFRSYYLGRKKSTLDNIVDRIFEDDGRAAERERSFAIFCAWADEIRSGVRQILDAADQEYDA